jgi:transposase-like protein
MIQVLDTEAAGIVLARGKLACPDCGQMMRPWGHARERTVRGLDGTLLTVRPDRALCRGCRVTHVLLDARLLPRRAYAVALIGKALLRAASGSGYRPAARELAVPDGTVRGWIRAARHSAARLRAEAIRTIVRLDQDAFAIRVHPSELAGALEYLGTAAMLTARRINLDNVHPWAMVNACTRGRLLTMPPAG